MRMCSKVADQIVTFNVSGTGIDISTDKLARHPDSLLTKLVDGKVQPSGGFFVECCPMLFSYILRFVVHDMQLDPSLIAQKLDTTEANVRKVVDDFGFKGIYSSSVENKEAEKKKAEVQKLYGDIWNLATKGKIDQLQLIADAGFDLDVKCVGYSSTPLLYAIQKGQLECVNWLLKQGADIKAVNKHNYGAVFYAVDSGSIEMLRLVIQKGADVNLVSEYGTPLHTAFRNVGKIELARELVKQGADLNIQDSDGRTSLYRALKYHSIEFIKELFTKDIDLTKTTKKGWSYLHIATTCNSLEVLKHLLQLGIDPTIKNKDGKTALFLAAEADRMDIFNELLKYTTN
jgi:ankyrin repeat protein